MPTFGRRRRKRPRRSQDNTAPSAARDWAALPGDVLLSVFLWLGPLRTMRGAGPACAAWRRVAAGEPALWRRVDTGTVQLWSAAGLLRAAVDRAAGHCEAFSGRGCDNASLLYLVTRAPSLKSLRLLDCEAWDVAYAIKKLPLLEYLEVSFWHFDPSCYGKLLQSVCKSCPRLKKLSLRLLTAFGNIYYSHEDMYIPVMRELRSLELTDCDLTVKKLMSIIDNCPLLESLNITHCFHHAMVEELQARYGRVKIRSVRHYC